MQHSPVQPDLPWSNLLERDRLKLRQTMKNLGVGVELEIFVGQIDKTGILIGDPDFMRMDSPISTTGLTAPNQ